MPKFIKAPLDKLFFLLVKTVLTYFTFGILGLKINSDSNLKPIFTFTYKATDNSLPFEYSLKNINE